MGYFPDWVYVTGGSVATSAATAHSLFGTVGVSALNLNNNQAVQLTVGPSATQARLGGSPGALGAELAGYRIPASETYTTPQMRWGDASRLNLYRIAADNPIVYWSLWRQRPGGDV